MTESANKPNISATASDELQTFIFEATHVRGEIVRLGKSWQTIQSHRSYPTVIKKHLGEMVAAGALLSATLKFDGTLIIQAQGTGAIRLLVVECTAQLGVRATVKLSPDFEGDTLNPNANLSDLLNPDGKGKLAITLDPNNRQEGQQAYQGIVPLLNEDGSPIKSIAEAIMSYMRNSEQLETRLWLASNDEYAAGILLQKLPSIGGKIEPSQIRSEEAIADEWERLQILANTSSEKELLETPATVMMNRLFQEESELQQVRSFPIRHVNFQCLCSRQRVGNMLIMLGSDEVDSILAEQGHVETECDFCGEKYHFDPVDCKQLFTTSNIAAGTQAPTGKH